MAEIAFHNVTKRYKDTLAVDDASFTVADNEFFGFFGPPLSGKSTILRLILGLEKPDSGEIWIDGRVVNAVSPAARRVVVEHLGGDAVLVPNGPGWKERLDG